MKRWRLVVAIGILVLLSVGLLLFIQGRKPMENRGLPPISVSDEPTATRADAPPQLGVPSQIEREKSKEEIIREYFSKKIDFYGAVKDGEGNPIAAANVEYSISSEWLSPNLKAIGGPKSNDEGRFAITGKQGASIFIRVTHPGFYETEQSKINFSFAQPIDALPTVTNPFVFVLRKKGNAEPLIKNKQVIRNLPKNGQPVEVGLAGQNRADLAIQTWTSPRAAGATSNAPFDWKVRVEVPGGGLVAYEDPYQFTAPEKGYAPFVEFAMPAGGIDGKWRDRFEETFFVKLPKGNYARVRFQMISGANHFAVVESYYNPTPGSRNLEFDPAKVAKSP